MSRMFSQCFDPDDSDRSPRAAGLLREEPDEEEDEEDEDDSEEEESEEEEAGTSTMMRVTTMTRMEEAMRYPRIVCVRAE